MFLCLSFICGFLAGVYVVPKDQHWMLALVPLGIIGTACAVTGFIEVFSE
jgi:hypothetical protein